MPEDPLCKLWCLVDGDSHIFSVTVPTSNDIFDLKEFIVKKNPKNMRDINAHDLVLLKLEDPIPVDPENTLVGRISKLKSDSFVELGATETVSQNFTHSLKNHLHVLVQVPSLDQHVAKRARLDDTPHTPQTIHRAPAQPDTPPRLKLEEMEQNMATAFEPYKEYISYLVAGKLDGYLDSMERKDKIPVPDIELSTDTSLLLHDLGKRADMKRIDALFVRSTVHLFNTSGSGKTRMSLDGLCHNWGFYISCRGRTRSPSGSRDYEQAVHTVQRMSTWNDHTNNQCFQQNQRAADRIFIMLICVRFFVLKKFLDCIPKPCNVMDARRRWVFLQVLPPRDIEDIFVDIFSSIRGGDFEVMRNFVKSMFHEIANERWDLFPHKRVYIVIDEAQEAAKHLKECFPPTTQGSTAKCSALHEVYRCFRDLNIFTGIIVSGTGLSLGIVTEALSSGMVKDNECQIFSGTGHFLDGDSQEAYVRRYLTLSDDNASDRRLLKRIKHWFAGRHRFTASLIELLLLSENLPRHRILTAFVEFMTGFMITDAKDLEDKEGPIPDSVLTAMYCRKLVEEECLMQHSQKRLLAVLHNTVMQWVIGSQLTKIPKIRINCDIPTAVELGVGHLETPGVLNPRLNDPVYIAEPLIVLSLSLLFERNELTQRKTWMSDAVSSAHHTSSYGYMFEEIIMFALMDQFGGKFTTLGDVFHFSKSSKLASRAVTLVSLMQMNDDGVMSCCDASWTTGASDRFGFKAQSPADVLEFLQNPKGKPFLFPDNHMGPDLICFLKDEETQELILLVLQSKITKKLDFKTWMAAVSSIAPNFFYTMITDGARERYAPLKYPKLEQDIEDCLCNILGAHPDPAPVTNVYRSKLRSSTVAKEECASEPRRQTPRYLRVIASPDDNQSHRSEVIGGEVVMMKRDVMGGSDSLQVITSPMEVVL